MLWRIYQLAIGIASILFFGEWIEKLVGTGWPFMITISLVMLFTAYYGTILTLYLAQKANAARLIRRKPQSLND